ncbi:MAG: cytochrome c3 family protein [Thermodesulfobacteriota bacterium]
MKKLYGSIVAFGFALAFCGLSGNAEARVTGVCSDCHTMHNSQNGASMANDGTNTPQRALTRGDCVGCHSGTALLGGSSNIPLVLKTDAAPSPVTSVLAGGNFYWVADAQGDVDKKGHNVKGIATQDGAAFGLTPPGWSNDATFTPTGGSQVAGGAASWASQLTCAGSYGCHGKHAAADDFQDISGAHHADDATLDGSTVGKSFRFLMGITGVEDNDWENETSVDRNKYKGKDRISDELASVDKSTISFLCAECHGNFHSGTGNTGVDSTFGAPWLRHPVDFDLSDATGSEYAAYVDNAEAPVGVVNLAAAVNPAVAGQAIVTCISCHRAHGTSFDDLLRWDYATMNAHNAGAAADSGCFKCHTNKD